MRSPSLFSLPKPATDAERLRRRHMLARLSLAWLANMQVMMFAFPGYLRDYETGEDNLAMLEQVVYVMNWISFALTVPVILYCAWPIWEGAMRRMRWGGVSMDVPVALGIAAAFIPSVYTTWFGTGEVYFESVTMFVAFLLTARYLEFCARHTSGQGRSHQYLEQFRLTVSVHANRLAFWFVVIQIVLAIVVGAVWAMMAPEHALSVTVALLVMSCPCAMSMAVPSAVAAANACMLRNGNMSDAEVVKLVQHTGRTTRQNLYGSIAWHFLMTPLAAFGLVQPWLAAVAMLVSSLAVAANSWRLYHRCSRSQRGPRLQGAAA